MAIFLFRRLGVGRPAVPQRACDSKHMDRSVRAGHTLAPRKRLHRRQWSHVHSDVDTREYIGAVSSRGTSAIAYESSKWYSSYTVIATTSLHPTCLRCLQPAPLPGEILMLRPDVFDGRVDWAASVRVDLASANINASITVAKLSALAASAGLVILDADTGIPILFGEMRAQRRAAQVTDVPAICNFRVSNHSVDAADTVRSPGTSSDPCKSGVGE